MIGYNCDLETQKQMLYGLELSKQHGFNVRNFRYRFCVF